MTIAVVATRNILATAYGANAAWFGVATGDPGTSSTPANEATGGSPAYARKQTTWGTAASSAISGTPVTVDLPAGTYTYGIVATAATGNTMADKFQFSSPTTLASQLQIVITPTYAQS